MHWTLYRFKIDIWGKKTSKSRALLASLILWNIFAHHLSLNKNLVHRDRVRQRCKRVLCGRSLLFERNRKYNSGILRNITNATLASKRASTSNHIQRCTGIYIANMDVLHILSVLVLLTVVSVDSLMFHLAANQKKCLKEEIHKDVLVTGEYQLSDVPGHKTQLLVLTTLCLFMESYVWIFISSRFIQCVSCCTTSLNACLYTVPSMMWLFSGWVCGIL